MNHHFDAILIVVSHTVFIQATVFGKSHLTLLPLNRQRPHGWEHHKSLRFLHHGLTQGTLEDEDAERCPSQYKTAKSNRDQPVKNASLISTTEYMVQRRRIDNEHCKARAAKYTGKVVGVADERKAEGDLELALDSEHIEALVEEDAKIHYRHCLGQGIYLHWTGDYLSTRIMEIWTGSGEVDSGLLRITEFIRRES